MKLQNQVVFALALLGCGSMCAADDPFVGKWKLNADKSQFTGFREEIKDLGGNKYEFKFGDDTEMIVADGKQQPSKYGGTWAIKKDSANQWTETHEHGGKVTSTSTWMLSDDGNQLTIQTKGTRADGSSFTENMSSKRVGSGSGLTGTWESTQAQFAIPDWEIKAWGTDGLSFTTPSENEHLDMKFDGKDYTDRGPRAAPGSTSSGKRVDNHTIEMTDKMKGKVMDTSELKVSDDGKSLTLTMHFSGIEKPGIFVYEKQ